MSKSFDEVLASVPQLDEVNLNAGIAQVSEFYGQESLWAVAAMALQSIEGAQIYDGRDGNQLFFISDRAPGQRTPASRRRNRQKVQQVTGFKTGTALFNNVAAIDPGSITEVERAKGQLLAHEVKAIQLTPTEIKNLKQVAGITEAESD